MMERFLSSWDILETFYRDSLEVAFPLANRKDEVTIENPFETPRILSLRMTGEHSSRAGCSAVTLASRSPFPLERANRTIEVTVLMFIFF